MKPSKRISKLFLRKEPDGPETVSGDETVRQGIKAMDAGDYLRAVQEFERALKMGFKLTT